MTTALLALNTALAAGYLLAGYLVLRHLQARDRLERDERARDAAERDTAAVRHAQQVEMLLQRIQAPQIAVMQHQVEQAGPDETWPMNDEESVEARQERELALERLEQLEREGIPT